MVIEPKYRGFICTTAHPTGCAQNVEDQIRYIQAQGRINGPKRVLIVGSSTGYGLASQITAAYGLGADTVGVFLEKAGTGKKTGTAGWYNHKAFETFAKKDGLKTVNINGDAFSDEVKQKAIEGIRSIMPEGKVDLVVYSLAAPKSTDPETGRVYSSVIKPIGAPFQGKTVDFHTGVVTEISVSPASEDEIFETVKVMGGGDWKRWMEALLAADALAEGAKTVAFSYIGPAVTHAIYKDGTIGQGKLDLEAKATEIQGLLAPLGGQAFVSINKGLVTQASAAIPVVPLYISILFKVMKEKGLHEGCIEQIGRLFKERLYADGEVPLDEEGRIRIDDLEMREDVQKAVSELWQGVDTESVEASTDLAGFRADFFQLFGFGRNDVDYSADVSIE